MRSIAALPTSYRRPVDPEASDLFREAREGQSLYHCGTEGGRSPAKKPRVPTDARSEFLANRAMGDWAEQTLAQAIREYLPEWSVSQYGNTESIAAGDPKFKDFYLAGLDEVRRYGKRPDLLVFPAKYGIAPNLSELPFDEIDPLANKAIASVEVRSSKYEALKYIEVRRKQKEEGENTSSRDSPSFTVKVEDLVIVYRWLERKRIPQAYFQVFFDSVFAINFLDIFARIGEHKKGLVIEKPEKSQEKATIMIPITEGVQVGKLHALPKFEVEHRVTALGRHDAYVKPIGGKLELYPDAVRRCLLK
jgi:AccI restriction endonuclease